MVGTFGPHIPSVLYSMTTTGIYPYSVFANTGPLRVPKSKSLSFKVAFFSSHKCHIVSSPIKVALMDILLGCQLFGAPSISADKSRTYVGLMCTSGTLAR